MDLTCAVCGRSFTAPPSKSDQKCCSPDCRFQAQRVVLQRSCERCGAGFTPSTQSDEQRYCSRECSGLARRRVEERSCATCGKVREVRLSAIAAGRGRHCSRRCYEIGKRRQVELVCVHCSKPFTVERSRAIGRRACSQSCRYGVESRRSVVACEVCSKSFSVFRSRLASGGGRVCSRECLKTWRRRNWPRRSCLQCRRTFYPPAGRVKEGGGLYCSRACVYLAKAPRSFKCRACKADFTAPAWRKPLYCSLSCTNRGRRRRQRDPVLTLRDTRILELHGRGLKAPEIQRQLADNPDWIISAAAVRQVIHRAV